MSFLRSPWGRGLVLAYIVIWVVLAAYFIPRTTPEMVFQHDAASYHEGAVNLAQSMFYSVDGVNPFFEREPGMSFFLSIVYSIFGIGSIFGIYFTQGVLFLIAVIVFMRELTRIVTPRAAYITAGLLLLFPATFHTILSPNRENFSLILFLFFCTSLLGFIRLPSLLRAIGTGLILGCLVLTYVPFLFLSIFLLPLLWLHKLPKVNMAVFAIIPICFALLWVGRNALQGEPHHLVGPVRPTMMWVARGEQAEKITGTMPFRCLWSEYISRNWEGVPNECSVMYFLHVYWPDDLPRGDEDALASAGQHQILRHLPGYLWFSVFEVLELHLPFVNGWGRIYNIFAAAGTVILYVGCLCALPILFSRKLLVFLAFILYSTLVFSLTDATPRYLMVTIFAYAVIAGVGYDRLLARLWNRSAS